MPLLPDELIVDLVRCGLTTKDAKTLISLDNGERLDYFDEVKLHWTGHRLLQTEHPDAYESLKEAWHIPTYTGKSPKQGIDKVIANW
jgi:hypothetical protein